MPESANDKEKPITATTNTKSTRGRRKVKQEPPPIKFWIQKGEFIVDFK
jgi:hypothetical protein